MKLKQLAILASAALLALSGLVLLLSGPSYLQPTNTAQYARTSVMITNKELTSGGTGVILSSRETESLVLTNRHVCRVIESGGVVSQGGQKYLIKAYMESKQHDLCLIKIAADLGVNTRVAEHAPRLYSSAHISGHPHLLPNVVSHGDFSNKMNIDVMTGIKQCDEEDLKDKDKVLLCIFLGGIPVVETFESQVVSATILPGSSGSAVFNGNGEISGLAFASSSRELAYAFVVPQEYVRHFVEYEARGLSWSLAKEDGSNGKGKISGVSRDKLELYNLARSILKLLLGDGASKYFRLDITTVNTSALWVKE